jgi:HK97 family phage prohead protease
MSKKEKRKLSFKDIEIRSSEKEGKKYVEGLIPYNSKSVPMWGTTEIIDRTAFNKTLADNSEVRAMWNHNDSHILGNTKSNTLVLENTDTGLICRCELPNTSYANDLYEIIERGDVKTMSFGFNPIKWEDSENGKLRTLKEVQLLEVSYGVTFPAYPETTSLTYLRGLKEMNIDVEKLNEILEKEELLDEDKAFIKEVIEILNGILKEDKEAGKDELSEDTQEELATSKSDAEDEKRKLVQLQIEAELNY